MTNDETHTGASRVAVLIAIACVGACGIVLFTFLRPDAARAADGNRRMESPSPLPPGKWYRVRERGDDGSLSEAQVAQIEALEAMGYATGMAEATPDIGVTVVDRERAQPGVNLFVSGHGPEAFLMDLDGIVIHKWARLPQDVWPDSRSSGGSSYWRRASVRENGDLFAIFNSGGMVKLDRDSNVRWAYDGRAHHDLDVHPDGRVFVLDREAYIAPEIDPERPILDDFITVLDPAGGLIERISLLDCILDSPLRGELMDRIMPAYRISVEQEEAFRAEHAAELAANPEKAKKLKLTGDIFHTNAVMYLDGALAHVSPHFVEGSVLVSISNMHLVAAVDLDAKAVVWALDGDWRNQHEAVLLDTGRLILFDNNGPLSRGQRGFSEVLELDPLTGEVVWSYRAQEPMEFCSGVGGFSQRLANGNTLITDSVNARAFELTPDRELVWDFFNPFRAGARSELVAFLPHVERLSVDFPTDWCTGPPASEPGSGNPESR